MRVKIVKIENDDKEYKIGAITLEQVEQYIAPIENLELRNAKVRAYDLLCMGINNALQYDNPAIEQPALWNQDRVRKELDMVWFEKLQIEILQLSGLKLLSKEDQLGEAPTAVVK